MLLFIPSTSFKTSSFSSIILCLLSITISLDGCLKRFDSIHTESFASLDHLLQACQSLDSCIDTSSFYHRLRYEEKNTFAPSHAQCVNILEAIALHTSRLFVKPCLQVINTLYKEHVPQRGILKEGFLFEYIALKLIIEFVEALHKLNESFISLPTTLDTLHVLYKILTLAHRILVFIEYHQEYFSSLSIQETVSPIYLPPFIDRIQIHLTDLTSTFERILETFSRIMEPSKIIEEVDVVSYKEELRESFIFLLATPHERLLQHGWLVIEQCHTAIVERLRTLHASPVLFNAEDIQEITTTIYTTLDTKDVFWKN